MPGRINTVKRLAGSVLNPLKSICISIRIASVIWMKSFLGPYCPGVRKSYLAKEYRRSMAGKLQPDCREQCYACGVLPDYAALRRQFPGKGWKCPDVSVRHKQPKMISIKL